MSQQQFQPYSNSNFGHQPPKRANTAAPAGKLVPPSKGLINPDLTQQIRNNMFVLLDAFKVMRAFGLEKSAQLEFQQALGQTNKPLDNLDVIVLLLKNSPYPEVQKLEKDITLFFEGSRPLLKFGGLSFADALSRRV